MATLVDGDQKASFTIATTVRCTVRRYYFPWIAQLYPRRLPAFLESLMPLKNLCSIHSSCSKISLKHPIRFCGIVSEFKTEFYCISFF